MNQHVPVSLVEASFWLPRWPDLHAIFRSTPVLPGEDEAAYRALLEGLLQDARPRDRFEAIWIKDAADLAWEMRRLNDARLHLLSRARGEAAKKLIRRKLEPGSPGL